MSSLRGIVSNMTFQRKLIFSFSLLASAMIACVGVWSMYTVSRHAMIDMEHTVEQSANYINQNTSILFADAIASFSLTKNYSVSQFLNMPRYTPSYEITQKMQALLSNWRLVQKKDSPIIDLSVMSVQGYGFSERNGYFRLPDGFMEQEQVKELLKSPRNIHIWGAPTTISVQPWEKEVVYLATGIFKTGTNEVAGIWRVSLHRNYLTNVLDSSKISAGGHVLILDRLGTPVFADASTAFDLLNPSQLERIVSASGGSGLLSERVQGAKSMIAFRALDEMDWYIVSTVPERELLAPTRAISSSIILSFFITLLLMIAINMVISRNLSRPLIDLTMHMQKVAQGDLDAIASVGGGKEIQFLCESFNNMLVDIKALMNRVVIEQQNLQRSELKALQEQINPHFLYNSMDSAVWAAENGNSEEVIDLLMSLSKFYKLTLSGGMDIVPLHLELQHVACYLEVLHMRYNDLFEYTIDTQGDFDGISFPKIILQPLAENAIYHGIKECRYPNGDKGHLSIRVCREKGQLTLAVADNGKGMSPEELAALYDRIGNAHIQPDGSYGLQNVNQRLRLFWGEYYQLSINTAPDEGFCILIRIALTTKEADIHEI